MTGIKCVLLSKKEIKVKLGDNLTKIAKSNNTTIEAIMKLNPKIKNPNVIIVGWELILP